jgi:hypothetical protein
MSEGIEGWQRPYFTAGGGDAMLLYAIYGSLAGGLHLSRSKHRSAGLPEGVELSQHSNDGPDAPFAALREGALWDDITHERPELAAAIVNAPQVFVLRGSVADPPDLLYLRSTLGVIAALLDSGCSSVFDAQILKWSAAQDWQRDVFERDDPQVFEHAAILVSAEDDGRRWYHTRGLRKFGRRDISVHGVTAEHEEAVVELCNRYIQYQALGGVVADDSPIRMKGLPEGCFVRHGGDLDDPDFNNVHFEVCWPD